MNYLLLFTITPVQDFISQSRKLKDLFGSSEILSCMSEIGLKICKREGAKEIFPILDEESSSYPNRFLVEFENKSLEEIKKLAKEEIEESLLKFLRGLNDKNHPLIQKHIENYFTFYWAISEIKNSDYKTAFDEVEKRLAGAKNTRFFTQMGEFGRKCSICGERNVAIYKKPMRFYIDEQKNSLLDARKEDNIQNGEGLCGICYIKRKYAKTKFNSTADVALMNIPDDIKKKYSLLNKDSQLFYEENLTEQYFKKNSLEIKKLNEYKKELKAFQAEIKDKYKQSSYYAVIMFDGDDMGEWLSGEKLDDKSRLKEFHQSLSQKLTTFAKETQNILKPPKGITVYAGGEDFLGFVNINNIFDVLLELREKWNDIINTPLKNEFSISDNFTFSAGVVIAHYKTPLGVVLNQVRKSEKKAKQNSEKDSICITALKRSGEIRESVIKYAKISDIQNIIEELKSNFSDSFISNLEKEFLIMLDEDNNLNLKNSLMMTEVERLLKRSKKIDNVDIEPIKGYISSIYTKEFINFSEILNICKFISRETK